MLEHQFHKIIPVSQEDDIAYFFIELTDKPGNKFGFQWILQKVLIEGDYKKLLDDSKCLSTNAISEIYLKCVEDLLV